VIEYLHDHILEIVAIQLICGIILGAISSLIAIRKYLKL
jgi:hypothetical protein